MSVSTCQRVYNTLKAGYKCLTSKNVYLLDQKLFLKIHFEKNLCYEAVPKICKMRKQRDKMILTTIPIAEKIVNQPLINLIANSIDDFFNVLF